MFSKKKDHNPPKLPTEQEFWNEVLRVSGEVYVGEWGSRSVCIDVAFSKVKKDGTYKTLVKNNNIKMTKPKKKALKSQIKQVAKAKLAYYDNELKKLEQQANHYTFNHGQNAYGIRRDVHRDSYMVKNLEQQNDLKSYQKRYKRKKLFGEWNAIICGFFIFYFFLVFCLGL